MSHTPGPWRVTVNPARGILVKGPNAYVMMRHPLTKSWKRNQELYANACLVAAAPELYEALEAAYMVLKPQKSRFEEYVNAVTLARAALAKVREEVE